MYGKKINLLSTRRFSVRILNDTPVKEFLLKMQKKNGKFGLNYDRHTVQPLNLRVLRCSF